MELSYSLLFPNEVVVKGSVTVCAKRTKNRAAKDRPAFYEPALPLYWQPLS